MIDQKTRDNIRQQRYKLMDALGLLNQIEGAKTEEKRNQLGMKYAELLVELVEPHLLKASQPEKGISNAKVLGDLKVNDDGSMNWSDEGYNDYTR